MSLDRVLSQQEIDNVFRNLRDAGGEIDPAKEVQPYDFRRPDRIPKDQLRSIHLLHDNFARSLASSLSAYLRAYVTVNLVSVEQLSFMEFSQCLPSPTVMISLGMKPYDGNAVLEINPTLIFPILEMVLGGAGTGLVQLSREITEIERSILDGVTRIILHDLRDCWRVVSQLAFSVEGYETEPQLLQILAPNEAVVAVSMEVRIGDNVGMINLGVPSIILKMLRQRFDQQWSLRKTESTEEEQARLLNLVKSAKLHIDARLSGSTLKLQDMLSINVGDVLALDYPVDHAVRLEINGKQRYTGQVVDNGRKRAFLFEELSLPDKSERSLRNPLRSLVAAPE